MGRGSRGGERTRATAPAAIRDATPVGLLRVDPSDLATLFGSVPELRDAMRIVVRDRLPDIAPGAPAQSRLTSPCGGGSARRTVRP
jgi:hypothetical protein